VNKCEYMAEGLDRQQNMVEDAKGYSKRCDGIYGMEDIAEDVNICQMM
jgi:hypothetical protein